MKGPEEKKEVVEPAPIRAYCDFEDTSGAVYIDLAAGCCYPDEDAGCCHPGEFVAGPGT